MRRRPAAHPVDFHVFPEGGGVRVGLVAAVHSAVVRFVGGVDVGVLLPVGTVREPSVATFEFAFKWFFT